MLRTCGPARDGSDCPLCYEGKKGRAAHKGHFGYSPSALYWRRKWMALKRRQAVTPGTSSTCSGVGSCDLSTLFPTVAEFLSLCVWEDGQQRVTGTLNVSTEGPMWKAALNDRDGGLFVFVSARTLTELLTRLETGLRMDDLEWRQSKPWGQGKGGRK